MPNYYEILKVSPKATPREIKSAYRRLARKLHPDVIGNSDNSTSEFALVAEAYEILSNSRERSKYDQKLSNPHTTSSPNSVVNSENPHAKRMREIALERKYNDIIDRIIAHERRESMELQKIIFPIVALFLSTVFVAIFRPLFFTNAALLGKIILFTLFAVGLIHLISRLHSGLKRFTYDSRKIDDSLIDAPEDFRQYSRFAGLAFLVVGLLASIGVGILIGDYLEYFISSMMPKLFSPTMQPEFIFYPPIVVLFVDVMHSISSKLEG